VGRNGTERRVEKYDEASDLTPYLWRRFRQVEKLSPAQRKPIIQVLDAFLQGTPQKRG
jgi:hypothetical protein